MAKSEIHDLRPYMTGADREMVSRHRDELQPLFGKDVFSAPRRRRLPGLSGLLGKTGPVDPEKEAKIRVYKAYWEHRHPEYRDKVAFDVGVSEVFNKTAVSTSLVARAAAERVSRAARAAGYRKKFPSVFGDRILGDRGYLKRFDRHVSIDRFKGYNQAEASHRAEKAFRLRLQRSLESKGWKDQF